MGIETDLVTPVPKAEFTARADRIDRYFRERLQVEADGAACPAAVVEPGYERLPREVVIRIGFRCPRPIEQLLINYLVFFDIDSKHRGIGTIDAGAGPEEFVVDPTLTEIEVEVARTTPPKPWIKRAAGFVRLGIEHILTGYDHVLFLIALLIVSARFWHLVKVVTAFTVAHSVTLSLAWFGVVDLPVRLVESLIALSIAYVAIENLLGRGFGHRWLLAFGFGLVHGFGFYGILRELDLVGGEALTPLFAFNFGVEIGQIAILAVFYGPLVWAFSRPWYARAMQAGSTVIVLVAGYWFAIRAFL